MKTRAIPFREYLLKNMSPVVRFLILAEVCVMSGTGLLGPIFALFIVDFIEGGSPAVAGAAATIFLLTKSLLQLPIAMYIDRIRGEKDDFWFLFVGTLIAALMPLFYLVIRTPLQLYVVQFFYGAAVAMTFPSYMAIFTRHIDREKEGTEWGVFFLMTDLASATAAALGGILAETAGFPWVIVGVSCLVAMGSLVLIPIRKHIRFS